jgi:hypothetical protein
MQHKTSTLFPKLVDAPRKTPPSNMPTRHGSNTRKISAVPNSCEGENSVASKKIFCRHHYKQKNKPHKVRIPRLAVTSSRLPRSPKPNRRVAFPFEVTRLIYSCPQYKRGICPCPVLSLNRAAVRAQQICCLSLCTHVETWIGISNQAPVWRIQSSRIKNLISMHVKTMESIGF